MLGDQEMFFFEKLLEDGEGREILFGIDPFDEPLDHAANFIIHDQLFETEAAFKIEHPRTRDAVNP